MVGEVSLVRRKKEKSRSAIATRRNRTLETHLTARSEHQGLPIPDLIRQPDIDHRRGKEPYKGAYEQQRYYRVGYRIVRLDAEEERAGGRIAPSYLSHT
jgi:hypothetical protein